MYHRLGGEPFRLPEAKAGAIVGDTTCGLQVDSRELPELAEAFDKVLSLSSMNVISLNDRI
ncbi:hypothetical protein DERP_009552 [Dermatophagoides pteronyssinus]|uniref:Uncharacterized protein n=1 Tax=Dermatophagoides pteronyssinus TaxID=6956 RepID=A0ABQ8JA81_DERPT|nr:hypothetical protein DERP_009552 [Dermatophagoides pteronyssinus]